MFRQCERSEAQIPIARRSLKMPAVRPCPCFPTPRFLGTGRSKALGVPAARTDAAPPDEAAARPATGPEPRAREHAELHTERHHRPADGESEEPRCVLSRHEDFVVAPSPSPKPQARDAD